MRYALAWAAALVAASLGSASLLTTLIPDQTVDAAALLDWGVNARDVPPTFVGISVSAANRGSGLVEPPEPGQPEGPTHKNALSGAAALQASILRFPDDVSQSYHWSTAYGSSRVDTDRFMRLAGSAGADDTMITVNMMDGSDDEARNWVAYVNAPSSTQFGQIRTERGHPDPYEVLYWLLGEDIMDRPDRFPSALSYVEAALANASAMKTVSRSIQVGLWVAPGDTEEERAWNDALVVALKSLDPGQVNPSSEPLIDFLGVAVTAQVPNRPVTDATLFNALYGYAADRARTVLERAEQVNQRLNPSLPLAVYRYDLEFAEDGWNQDKGDSIGATVTITGMLNEFIRHDSLFTVIYRGLNSDDYGAVLKVTTRYDLPTARQFDLNPIGEVLASFAQYSGGKSIQVEYSGAGATAADASHAFYSAPALGRIGLQERVPLVSIGSCFDTAQGQMVIWLASRSAQQPVTVHVRVQVDQPVALGPAGPDGTVRPVIQEVTGSTIATDRYTGFERVIATGREVVLPTTSATEGVFEFELTLEPHSVSTVVFRLVAVA